MRDGRWRHGRIEIDQWRHVRRVDLFGSPLNNKSVPSSLISILGPREGTKAGFRNLPRSTFQRVGENALDPLSWELSAAIRPGREVRRYVFFPRICCHRE